MWWMLAAQVGMSSVSAFAGHQQSKEQYKVEKKWQKYRNTMSMLSAAQTQNAVTTNQTMATIESAAQALEIQKSELVQRGDAKVQAAAAGVSGGSVGSTLNGIARGAAQAQRARKMELENKYLGFTFERRNIAMGAAMNKDVSYIPKPDPLSAMLGFAKDATAVGIDNYDYLSDLWG